MATEKRLVNAHEVEELFYKQVEYGATDLMDAFDDALQDAKTVDAVEVVRCKDCKHRYTMSSGMSFCKKNILMGASDNGFCSCGERRCDNEVD